MTSLAYVDASALVKLVVVEVESAQMLRWYVESERVVTSRVGILETRRAAARHPHEARFSFERSMPSISPRPLLSGQSWRRS